MICYDTYQYRVGQSQFYPFPTSNHMCMYKYKKERCAKRLRRPLLIIPAMKYFFFLEGREGMEGYWVAGGFGYLSFNNQSTLMIIGGKTEDYQEGGRPPRARSLP